MPAPPLLDAIEARMRALPQDNPRWPTDALLLACDYVAEMALFCRVAGQHHAADHAMNTADRWRDLARAFAPPAPETRAAQLAGIEHAIRQEPQA